MTFVDEIRILLTPFEQSRRIEATYRKLIEIGYSYALSR